MKPEAVWEAAFQELLSLQCLEKCREDVCSKLGLEPSDVELSMGMSQDFEQAVRRSSLCIFLCRAAMPCMAGTGYSSPRVPYCGMARTHLHAPVLPLMARSKEACRYVHCCQTCQDSRLCSIALQIEMGSTNVRVGSTIFGARDYAKWTERPRDKEQDPESE